MQRPERRWDKVTALGESFFLKRGLELTPLGRTPADTLRVCNLAADCMPVAVHGTCSFPLTLGEQHGVWLLGSALQASARMCLVRG